MHLFNLVIGTWFTVEFRRDNHCWSVILLNAKEDTYLLPVSFSV